MAGPLIGTVTSTAGNSSARGKVERGGLTAPFRCEEPRAHAPELVDTHADGAETVVGNPPIAAHLLNRPSSEVLVSWECRRSIRRPETTMSLSENAYGIVTAVSTTPSGSLVALRQKNPVSSAHEAIIQAFLPASIHPPEGEFAKPGDRVFLMGELDIIPGCLLPDGNDLAMLRVEMCLHA